MSAPTASYMWNRGVYRVFNGHFARGFKDVWGSICIAGCEVQDLISGCPQARDRLVKRAAAAKAHLECLIGLQQWPAPPEQYFYACPADAPLRPNWRSELAPPGWRFKRVLKPGGQGAPLVFEDDTGDEWVTKVHKGSAMWWQLWRELQSGALSRHGTYLA